MVFILAFYKIPINFIPETVQNMLSGYNESDTFCYLTYTFIKGVKYGENRRSRRNWSHLRRETS